MNFDYFWAEQRDAVSLFKWAAPPQTKSIFERVWGSMRIEENRRPYELQLNLGGARQLQAASRTRSSASTLFFAILANRFSLSAAEDIFQIYII